MQGGTVAWWGVDGHGAWVACRWVGGVVRLGGSGHGTVWHGALSVVGWGVW
jgi:hypothetical protein